VDVTLGHVFLLLFMCSCLYYSFYHDTIGYSISVMINSSILLVVWLFGLLMRVLSDHSCFRRESDLFLFYVGFGISVFGSASSCYLFRSEPDEIILYMVW
jgi:hypothetical protein